MEKTKLSFDLEDEEQEQQESLEEPSQTTKATNKRKKGRMIVTKTETEVQGEDNTLKQEDKSNVK